MVKSPLLKGEAFFVLFAGVELVVASREER